MPLCEVANAYHGGLNLEGKKHGEGTRTWANGNTYVGGWAEGKMHGEGTYTWADGKTYVGGWAEGKAHGEGTHTWADGGWNRSRWANDEEVEVLESSRA